MHLHQQLRAPWAVSGIRVHHALQNHSPYSISFILQRQFLPGLEADDLRGKNHLLSAIGKGRGVRQIRPSEMQQRRQGSRRQSPEPGGQQDAPGFAQGLRNTVRRPAQEGLASWEHAGAARSAQQANAGTGGFQQAPERIRHGNACGQSQGDPGFPQVQPQGEGRRGQSASRYRPAVNIRNFSLGQAGDAPEHGKPGCPGQPQVFLLRQIPAFQGIQGRKKAHRRPSGQPDTASGSKGHAVGQNQQGTVKDLHMDFFPLKEYKGIVEGNALRIDWESVVSKEKLNYIMGNPPFVGYDFMNPEQKKDMQTYFGQKTGRLDYVTAWYIKASKLIKRTKIRCAFVSTNSVTQGVQVPDLWKPVIKENGSHIDFAYRTFIWDSEANLKAHVHCVIIGFSYIYDTEERIIFDESGNGTVVKIISPYLIESDEIIVEKRSNALYDVPNLILGNMPKDGGGFVLTEDEREEFIKKEPLSEKWIKPYIGAVEFINNKKRYCLWLVDASPAEIKKCPMVAERVKRVREFRLASKALSTQKFGETPTLFCQISQPDKNFIIVPKTSSGRRRYVPLGFANKDIITSDLVFIIPGATLYEFGVLSSN